MTMEQIRKRARQLNDRTRGELLRNIAVTVFLVVLSAIGAVWVHDPWPRAIFALAIVWMLAGQYFIHRKMWPAPVPGDSGWNTGVEYYRREIERRRRLLGQVLQWTFGPVALALCGLILAILKMSNLPLQRTLVNMIPFLSLSVLWILGIFVLRFRGQRELQRETEELNKVER